jgi:uncharacterized RDD family membrane protein YckC
VDEIAINTDNANVDTDVLATRSSRFFAFLLDNVFALIFLLPFWLIYRQSILHQTDLTQMQILGIQSAAIIAYLILNTYFLISNGQTIAKKLLKIKIVRKNGAKISFGRILFLRLVPGWFFYMLPVEVLYGLFTLVDSLMIFGDKKCCLHDHIADSKVIKA